MPLEEAISQTREINKSQTKILDVPLLSTIKCFDTFAGCLYNPSLNNIPTILFKVQYHSGRTGFVHCGASIRGKTKTFEELFRLHEKVRQAKNLVSNEDWIYMEQRFGYSKAHTMEFEWLQDMRAELASEVLSQQGDRLSSVSSQSDLGRWGLGIALAVGIGIGVGLGWGFGIGVGFALGVGFGVGAGLGLAALGTRLKT
ncbi:hypothetical protein BJX76DRAFT_361389 [Aspergillus varians]